MTTLTSAPELTAICELRQHGPREVAELMTFRAARQAGVSAVAYQMSARRKLRDADRRERERWLSTWLEDFAA